MEVDSNTSTEEGEKTPEVPESTSQTTGTNSYSELGDGQVTEILSKYLSLTGYDSQQQKNGRSVCSGQSLDLVLFKGAIEHAARLCRSMVRQLLYSIVRHRVINVSLYAECEKLTVTQCPILLQNLPGSHALLIGAKGSGRRSLIRLIARAVSAKVIIAGVSL